MLLLIISGEKNSNPRPSFRLSKILVNPPCPFPKNWRPQKQILSLLLYFSFCCFFFLQIHARERRAPKPQAVCKYASGLRTSLAAKTVEAREERLLFSQVINALPRISLGPDFAVGEKAKNGVRRL